MAKRFLFEPREECVCGTRLTAGCAQITKPFSWGQVTFLQCGTCRTWCQSPAVTMTSLAEWLDSEDYRGSGDKAGAAYVNYLADEENRLIEARDRYHRDLEPLLPAHARVLEIGCATGSLLSVIRARGHDTFGVDLSPTFAEVARSRHGLRVLVGDAMHASLPTAHFDAVIAMGTVGNFRSVVEYFLRFRELLKPGGALVFNFSDADSAWVRYLYRDRFWMFTPSVRTFMTTRGCLAALARAGFGSVTATSDVQRPSLKKLAHHAGAEGRFVIPLLSALGLGDGRVPFPIPVPTVRLVVARPRGGDDRLARTGSPLGGGCHHDGPDPLARGR